MERRSPQAATEQTARQAVGDRIQGIARALLKALYPDRAEQPCVTLASHMERDLGLDSLGRAELIGRVETGFGVRLSSTALERAETLGDLAAAVVATGGESAAGAPGAPVPEAPELPLVVATPKAAASLPEVLEWHVERHPSRPHVTVLETDLGVAAALDYAALQERARRVAGGLRRRGVAPGDRVALMLPTGEDFFAAFFGCQYAGAVAVTIYPPFRVSHLESHLRRQAGTLRNAGAKLLMVSAETSAVSRLLRLQVPGLRHVDTVASLDEAGAGAMAAPVKRDGADPAFIQYTSGSTGDPKGVVLSHDNLLANIRAMGTALRAGSGDRFVSWLPLYHDMGLIGAWLGSLYYACPLYVTSPITFLQRPASWLSLLHRYRATLSAAPNFAFELCLKRVRDEELRGIDLSSLRFLANGAEAVSPTTLLRFADRFRDYGLSDRCIAPVYGLAESAVGLTFTPLSRGPLIDRVQREAMQRRGLATPAGGDAADVMEIVSNGRALPGHEVRIVDGSGREVAERHQGRVQFRGPSATRGYYENPEKNRELFQDGWVETGDMGYIAGGELYITGRVKDLIIRAGRNVYPQEVEEAVGDLEGVRKGCVAVFGTGDPTSGTERVVILAETRETEVEPRERLRRRIAEIADELLGTPADDIVLAPPHSVPKTSSGKLRRSAARGLYETGRLGRGTQPLWVQILRLGLAGIGGRMRRARDTVATYAFATRWWLLAGLAAVLGWSLVMLSPRPPWRLLRLGLRAFFQAAGNPVQVRGLTNLPRGGTVLVANHASYLDGLALAAVLPRPPVLVAKEELAANRWLGPPLRRLRTVFVARQAAQRSLQDLQGVVDAATRGDLVVLFPEGTFRREPGLLPFRLGAFVVAAETGVPVVPATLEGTRSALRSGQWLPRRASIDIRIGPTIEPSRERGFDAALEARQAARDWVVAHLSEPDAGGDRS